MKCWIIRSFFIGLLLLCVGEWGLSYKYWRGITYVDHEWHFWEAHCNWGQIHLNWYKIVSSEFGWKVVAFPAESGDANDLFYGHSYHLGFGFVNEKMWGQEQRVVLITIPFWCPTTLCAALLWLVWRKTRPKAVGRAFPVEVAKLSG